MAQTDQALLDAIDDAILALVSGEAVTSVVVNGQTLQFKQENLLNLMTMKQNFESRTQGGPRRSNGNIKRY